jgi:hypothetical protein
MDEDTERLRDIFVETTGTDSVTERQRADRGTLLAGGDRDRLAAVVAEMRERFDFETDLGDEALSTVVELFYEGADDAAIADALGVSASTVFEARADLHLLREDDADPELLAAVRAGVETDRLAAADAGAVTRARRVAAAGAEARRVSDRFRLAFADVFVEAGLDDRLAADARADGLREAAEDIETELDF